MQAETGPAELVFLVKRVTKFKQSGAIIPAVITVVATHPANLKLIAILRLAVSTATVTVGLCVILLRRPQTARGNMMIMGVTSEAFAALKGTITQFVIEPVPRHGVRSVGVPIAKRIAKSQRGQTTNTFFALICLKHYFKNCYEKDKTWCFD